MILEELDRRGLPGEVRRRLAVWLEYQGTAELRGNFTDQRGVFFGAGGYECGSSYNQHHGWVLWYLAEHYFVTRDDEWLRGVAGAMIAGADWIIRQRRGTMQELPHSRGWEKGFLPAGALEDVDDYFYWLSTNCLTWRGLDGAASALAAISHPDAERIRAEADEFRRDLVRGFETARTHSPLVRLRDGRWIPHYPSRLYRRGRDVGWIRETLEGSVYLLISGLYDPDSREAGWILDDYMDTRYMSPPFGYAVGDPSDVWFDRGGFSVQPALLAGLLPYLDRDEPEVYLWMFFNAWAACYREEIGAFVEHPMPVLGFSNSAPFKTSDQANAMKWLCCMFVYVDRGTLHVGRALPRAWFASLAGPHEEEIAAEGVSTRFGRVGVRYRASPSADGITADLDLDLREAPGRILVRFRHPRKRPIRSVRLDGEAHAAIDAVKGDVDVTGRAGRLHIEAIY